MKKIASLQELEGYNVLLSTPLSEHTMRLFLMDGSGEITEAAIGRVLYSRLRNKNHSLTEAKLGGKNFDFKKFIDNHASKIFSEDPDERKEHSDAHHELVGKLKSHIERIFAEGGPYSNDKS